MAAATAVVGTMSSAAAVMASAVITASVGSMGTASMGTAFVGMASVGMAFEAVSVTASGEGDGVGRGTATTARSRTPTTMGTPIACDPAVASSNQVPSIGDLILEVKGFATRRPN